MGHGCRLVVLALLWGPAVLAAGPPVDPDATRAPALVDVADVDRSIRVDLRYATRRNVTGRILYDGERAYLQQPAADALARAHRALAADGFGLLVLDAYRPWRVTKALWDATPPERRQFVADPSRGSRHNRGVAVDVTLIRLATGRPVAMPSEYDEFSDRASPTYAGGDAEARAARDRLRDAMERAGFFVHPAEWWHYDFKDWAAYPILDVPLGAVASRPHVPPPSLDLATARVVDLTHSFDRDTIYWPNAPSGFALDRLAFGPTPQGFFYAANAFSAPEHGGTHLDAPIHFAAHGWTADAIPLDRLVAPAVVLDVAAAVARDRDYRLTPADVRRFESAHGTIAAGTIVLLRTGWAAYWPHRASYLGDDTAGRTTHLHFPSYGEAAAKLLVRERRVAALGVDTASIDYGPARDFPVHRVAAAANVVGFENVRGLEALPPTGAWVAALPTKIAEGSGGPLRIVAFLPPAPTSR